MVYTLPLSVRSAQELTFTAPVRPRKNPSGFRGMMLSTGPGLPMVLGYRAKKWGAGQSGDKNARWRKGRGLCHGMRSTKFVVAKTAA